jgi:predicted transcriptional regulator
MKTKEQLKKELHEYIDSISDEETLMMVHEDVTSYLKKESEVEEDDELTEEQEKQLAEAIRQADAGEFISEEEYLKATARWRTK